PAVADGAGAMLRAARQQQGLHIAALAASIKVTPAKLEALEAGRYDELPDTTFARALAKTVCRVLKIDSEPVLAQMPGTPVSKLARVDGGLNTPFRERPGRVDPTLWVPWRHPVLWAVALLLVAAAAFVLVPTVSVIGRSSPLLDAASAPVMPPSGAAVLPLATDPVVAPPTAAAASTAATKATAAGDQPVAGGDPLTLRASQASWVQLVDGSGQTLMARLVPAGETVALMATPPLRLRIGNASGVELQFRGRPVDLKPLARDNIANLTLP
ncbi:MAG: helix-turn-helix domain-containing protein, partial [Microbacteriaceae bacterium]|nr:helix-turn-helix domain-containing protein [Burkholderiaceae bacterium]